MPVSSSLTERLPPDVLFSILYILPHNDIISMRKTCRLLAAISKRRALWLGKVKVICEEDTVFLASFPLEQMSAEELESVASGPTRFGSLLKRYGRTKAQLERIIVEREELYPKRQRTFNFDISSLEHLPQNLLFNIPKLYLIPGGRFLVLGSRNVLQLWDLGISLLAGRGSCKEPVLLAQHAEKDMDDFWLCTYTYNRSAVQALEIFPSAPNPQFKVLGNAHTSTNEVICMSVWGNILFIVCARAIKIWDFVKDTWACFGIKEEPRQAIASLYQIFLTSTMMALSHDRGVSFCGIPRLTPDGQNDVPTPQDPAFYMAHPCGSGPPDDEDEDDNPVSHFSQLDDWYTGSRQPLWLDYQRSDQPGVLHPFLIEISFSTFLQQNTLALDDLPTIHLPKFNFYPESQLASRVVGGKQVRMFIKATDNGPSSHSVREIDGVAQDIFFEVALTNLESSRPLETNRSFDPFSGRFCYYSHLSQSASMPIHVFDLFNT